ncbi:MAG: hypothetical protein NTU60_12630 [Candidatus Aminicenantes bacterium]|nr:hypothetical protein [Candidatus Aminicenantes bacterium]
MWQTFRYRSRILFLLSFLMILGLLDSCKSPASPIEPPITRPTFVYRLYDDFETGTIQDSLWYTPDSKFVAAKDDGTGNHICEIKDSSLMMISPQTIYPDEFDRLSARIRIPSEAKFLDYGAVLIYSVSILNRPRVWWTRLGIKKDSSSSAHLFANWEDLSSGRKWEVSLGRAQLDAWYGLEIQIIQFSSSQLKILYRMNGQDLAESIPEDSPVLLDHNQLNDAKRSLLIERESGGLYENAIGWFDDVWGAAGPNRQRIFSNQTNEPPSFIIVPPPSTKPPQIQPEWRREGLPSSPPSKRADRRK